MKRKSLCPFKNSVNVFLKSSHQSPAMGLAAQGRGQWEGVRGGTEHPSGLAPQGPPQHRHTPSVAPLGLQAAALLPSPPSPATVCIRMSSEPGRELREGRAPGQPEKGSVRRSSPGPVSSAWWAGVCCGRVGAGMLCAFLSHCGRRVWELPCCRGATNQWD